MCGAPLSSRNPVVNNAGIFVSGVTIAVSGTQLGGR